MNANYEPIMFFFQMYLFFFIVALEQVANSSSYVFFVSGFEWNYALYVFKAFIQSHSNLKQIFFVKEVYNIVKNQKLVQKQTIIFEKNTINILVAKHHYKDVFQKDWWTWKSNHIYYFEKEKIQETV